MALPVVHRCLCRVGVLIGVVEGVVECATRLMSVVITRNFRENRRAIACSQSYTYGNCRRHKENVASFDLTFAPPILTPAVLLITTRYAGAAPAASTRSSGTTTKRPQSSSVALRAR